MVLPVTRGRARDGWVSSPPSGATRFRWRNLVLRPAEGHQAWSIRGVGLVETCDPPIPEFTEQRPVPWLGSLGTSVLTSLSQLGEDLLEWIENRGLVNLPIRQNPEIGFHF